MIVASNGMLTGGRVVGHLRNLIDDPTATILFVGYQGEGTLGAHLQAGATEVKLDGQLRTVRCQVRSISGFSAHADEGELLDWLRRFRRGQATRRPRLSAAGVPRPRRPRSPDRARAEGPRARLRDARPALARARHARLGGVRAMRLFDVGSGGAGRFGGRDRRRRGRDGSPRVVIAAVLLARDADPGPDHRFEPATDRRDVRGRQARAPSGDDVLGPPRGRAPPGPTTCRRPAMSRMTTRPKRPDEPDRARGVVESMHRSDTTIDDRPDLAAPGYDREHRRRSIADVPAEPKRHEPFAADPPAGRRWRSCVVIGLRTGYPIVRPERLRSMIARTSAAAG